MKKLSYVAAAILLAQSAHSFASNGKLVGSVKDLHSHLSGVMITVKGQKATAVTDYRGRFELPNVESGEYTLLVSYFCKSWFYLVGHGFTGNKYMGV